MKGEKDRFDLESEIMDCWGICEDLDTIGHGVAEGMTADDVMNTLIGVKSLYELKFNKLWNTFEECIQNGVFENSNELNIDDFLSDAGDMAQEFKEAK